MHLATYSEWTQFERSDRCLCVGDFKKLDMRDLDKVTLQAKIDTIGKDQGLKD